MIPIECRYAPCNKVTVGAELMNNIISVRLHNRKLKVVALPRSIGIEFIPPFEVVNCALLFKWRSGNTRDIAVLRHEPGDKFSEVAVSCDRRVIYIEPAYAPYIRLTCIRGLNI